MSEKILKILGIDPGPHALGWCEYYGSGHQFGALDLRKADARSVLEAKIRWADVVYCESYRPREFLQGEGPKTAEVIGEIVHMCVAAGRKLEMVDHVTWRTKAANVAGLVTLRIGGVDGGIYALHLQADGALKGDHEDDAFWIAIHGAGEEAKS